MKLLALETSSSSASICIFTEGQVLALAQSSKPRFHSQWVHRALLEVLNSTKLQLSEIDCFAVGKGPGSFTGIRVAGSVMKSFAFLFQKPMVAVDSLTLLSYPIRSQWLQGLDDKKMDGCIAMIQAHKNQIYWSLYRKETENLQKLLLENSEIHLNFPHQIKIAGKEKWFCLGNAFDIYAKDFSPDFKSKWIREKNFSHEPLASSLAKIAYERYKLKKTLQWKEYLPLYIRSLEAEKKVGQEKE